MTKTRRPVKRDRRDGSCLKPTVQNPGAVTLARVTAGLGKQQLAAMAGISVSYLCEIEKGTRSVRAPKLKEIALACGLADSATLINPALAGTTQTAKVGRRAA